MLSLKYVSFFLEIWLLKRTHYPILLAEIHVEALNILFLANRQSHFFMPVHIKILVISGVISCSHSEVSSSKLSVLSTLLIEPWLSHIKDQTMHCHIDFAIWACAIVFSQFLFSEDSLPWVFFLLLRRLGFLPIDKVVKHKEYDQSYYIESKVKFLTDFSGFLKRCLRVLSFHL